MWAAAQCTAKDRTMRVVALLLAACLLCTVPSAHTQGCAKWQDKQLVRQRRLP